MADTINPLDTLPTSPDPEMYTISPADTSLDSPEPEDDIKEEEDEKKPAKKRKSWGQELPTPKTNLPPPYVCPPFAHLRIITNRTSKRAKTDDEKEQRRIERVLRNRAAAQTSRERKRLEMEKLETEKIRMEQQNQFLIQRLSQMETENNRLSQQVAQLSAEVRGSRSATPKASSPAIESPTLTPTLFKQEGDELPMERIPFPTPSVTDYSPTLTPSTLAEASDATQHPAAVLCDLQCPSEVSKELEAPSLSSTFPKNLQLQMTLQLLFLTMTSAACSTVIHPLSQILLSLKTGLPLMFSTAEIYQHFPLILWLISTPSLSSSKASSRPVFRMRLLTRLLACSPALARPLRDATGRALQLAVSEHFSATWSAGAPEARPSWELLLTMAWAIDSLSLSQQGSTLKSGRRRINGKHRVSRSSRSSRRLSLLSKR
jgi:transcriptional activator HAC1